MPTSSTAAQVLTSVPLLLATSLGAGVVHAPAEATQPATETADPQDGASEGARASAPAVSQAQPALVETRTLAAPVRAAGPTYTVRAGDTISHIAVRTGTSQSALIAANGLDRRGFIRAGQTLTLPTSSSSGSDPAAAPASTTRYTVRSGDTVGHIAVRTGVPQAAIVAATGLDRRGSIRAGQVLTRPASVGAAAPAAAPAAATSTGSYTVRSGDTLSGIAARRSTTVAALRAANPGLDSRGTIRVGQSLRVPAAPAPMPSTFAGRTYPDATVRAATANRDALAARPVPSREQMRQIIASAAREHGVDPALMQAIAFQESGFNQRSVSPANAVGAMQVIPSSGRWASEMAGRELDLLDPHDNAVAGVLVMKANHRASGDLPTAIAAYYQGLSSVRSNGMFADTRRYVANVQTLMNRYR